MHQIAIISGTNREDSYTWKVAEYYYEVVKKLNTDGKTVLADFRQLPKDIAFEEVYGKRTKMFDEFIEKYISGTEKFFWIVPEYNGSFAGITKLFIDAVHPRYFYHKKVCLTGVASGRAGNLRGMDHLAMIFQYLRMNVFWNKLPISRIEEVWGEREPYANEQKEVILSQIEEFLKY
ncbi:MAG: NADPH-dependent oxidoreductase [Bacteroidetes bacterium]|nr:MAG: NADPH-dependent oxidoreductase [Bacteroidota bacterium]